ncbi:hypothetical protein [Actinophytocola sediminis]
MDQTEQDGARLLSPLRDTEPGTPSTVSVHRAIHTGARRQRTGQALGALAVVAVTVFGVLTGSTILNGQQSAPPATPVGEFEPLRQEFGVGSAGGFTPVSYETGRYRQRVLLVPTDGSAGDAEVTMYAPGRLPDPPAGDPAPEVNGKRALWTGTALAWEWTANAWAFAMVDSRDVAHRVAQSVEPGAGAAVRLPFTVPAPDSGDPRQLVGVISPFGTSSDPAEGGLLVFGTRDPVSADDDADRVLVGVRRDLTRDLVTGDPGAAPVATTQLDGRPAAVSDTAVTILDTGGGYAIVAESTVVSTGELTELASSVRLVENPADQRSWRGVPLR